MSAFDKIIVQRLKKRNVTFLYFEKSKNVIKRTLYIAACSVFNLLKYLGSIISNKQ